MSCFQGLFFCPDAFSLLLHNFCIYHISPPGHELGAAVAGPDEPALTVDDLADQIVEILDYFGLGAIMCLGVTAGAYILTLFALKYSQRVMGLILVSPVCKAPSWTEWLCNKVLAIFLGGMSILSGHVSAEQLTKYVLYCEWLIYAAWRLQYSMSSLLQSLGACEKVFQLMHLPSSREFALKVQNKQLRKGGHRCDAYGVGGDRA